MDKVTKKEVPKLRVEDFTGEQVFEREAKNKSVYFPSWDNRPEEIDPIVELGGTGVLTEENILTLIAKPGIGKSSIMEATIAKIMNPDCDGLGIDINPIIKRALYVDNERTNTDVWNGFYRIYKRAGLDRNTVYDDITIAGMRAIARLEERKEEILKLIQEKKPQLVLIDGAGDLVNDVNNSDETTECKLWLRQLTRENNLSIILTLHPNPGSDKPRGWQGSELCRDSETVLLAKPYDDNVRILTTDFEYGKNRNNEKITTSYMWSDNEKMFISCDYEEVKSQKKAAKEDFKIAELEQLAQACLPSPNTLKRSRLIELIVQRTGASNVTAGRRLKDMVTAGIAIIGNDGNYRKKVS